mmetsp:Transcript_11666/g.19699  ORF Transcript_11666/g.19699 Transcript_11666/m.19699 type:complete len:132 (+) Transcript_11666:644-1039(+)
MNQIREDSSERKSSVADDTFKTNKQFSIKYKSNNNFLFNVKNINMGSSNNRKSSHLSHMSSVLSKHSRHLHSSFFRLQEKNDNVSPMVQEELDEEGYQPFQDYSINAMQDYRSGKRQVDTDDEEEGEMNEP